MLSEETKLALNSAAQRAIDSIPAKQEAKKLNIDLQVMKRLCTLPIEGFERFGQRVETPHGTFIYIDRGAKVLGVAHRDTVCDPSSHFSYDPKLDRVHNPGLDDRLGCTILLDWLDQLLPENSYDILLTEGEETGRSTAKFFQPPEGKDYNWMFQFDRGGMDAVHYQYTDPKWLKELSKLGCKIEKGMFSDIYYLEHLAICGVNVGTAYYRYHSQQAYSNLYEAEEMVEKFVEFFKANAETKFEHDSKKYNKQGEIRSYSFSSYNHQQPNANTNYYYPSYLLEDDDRFSDSYGYSYKSRKGKERTKVLDLKGSYLQNRLYWLISTPDELIDQTDPLAIQPKGHTAECICPVCGAALEAQNKRYATKEGREELISRILKTALSLELIKGDHYFNYCFCSSCIKTRQIKTEVEKGEGKATAFEITFIERDKVRRLQLGNGSGNGSKNERRGKKKKKKKDFPSLNSLSSLNSDQKEGSDQLDLANNGKTNQSFLKFCAKKSGITLIAPKRSKVKPLKEVGPICDWCWRPARVRWFLKTRFSPVEGDLLCKDCKEFVDQGGLD